MATQPAAAEVMPDLVNLTVTDWDGARRAQLEDVPSNATVAEILDEVRRIMALPSDASYQAVLGGRQLSNLDTLEETGVASGAELTIVPEVQAG